MFVGRNPIPALALIVVLLLAAVPASPGQDAKQDATAQGKAKKAINDALRAFNRTIKIERCTLCKGTGQRRKERCSACAGTGISVQCRPNNKAASDMARRYGIAKVFAYPNHPVVGATGEYPLEVALSAQHSLERYLDLLDLAREHAELLEKDKHLRSAVENARKHGRAFFGRDQSLFEAIAYQIAKSSKDVKGAGVCLTGVVEQVVTINEARYARLEEAEHAWLVRVPENVRWTEKSIVRVIGRIVDDAEYTTVLGASRAATIVEPSLDSE